MSIRSYNYPSVEIKEVDATGATITASGSVSLINGFTNKGEIFSPTAIGSTNAFLSAFGKPTNDAEFYAFLAVEKVISEGGTPLVIRLPYSNEASQQYNGLAIKIASVGAQTATAENLLVKASKELGFNTFYQMTTSRVTLKNAYHSQVAASGNFVRPSSDTTSTDIADNNFVVVDKRRSVCADTEHHDSIYVIPFDPVRAMMAQYFLGDKGIVVDASGNSVGFGIASSISAKNGSSYETISNFDIVLDADITADSFSKQVAQLFPTIETQLEMSHGFVSPADVESLTVSGSATTDANGNYDKVSTGVWSRGIYQAVYNTSTSAWSVQSTSEAAVTTTSANFVYTEASTAEESLKVTGSSVNGVNGTYNKISDGIWSQGQYIAKLDSTTGLWSVMKSDGTVQKNGASIAFVSASAEGETMVVSGSATTAANGTYTKTTTDNVWTNGTYNITKTATSTTTTYAMTAVGSATVPTDYTIANTTVATSVAESLKVQDLTGDHEAANGDYTKASTGIWKHGDYVATLSGTTWSLKKSTTTVLTDATVNFIPGNNVIYAASATPAVNDKVYSDASLTTQFGVITAVDTAKITVGGTVYNYDASKTSKTGRVIYSTEYSNWIGIAVCKMTASDSSTGRNIMTVVESYVGSIAPNRDPNTNRTNYVVDLVNSGSSYVRMYANRLNQTEVNQTSVSGGNTVKPLPVASGADALVASTDTTAISNSAIKSVSFQYGSDMKKIKGGTLGSDLATALTKVADVDSYQIDIVEDAGLSSIAQFTSQASDGEFYDPDTDIDTNNGEIQSSAMISAWSGIVSQLTSFCSGTRKDCMAILDAPRNATLKGSYPIVSEINSDATFSDNLITGFNCVASALNSSYAAVYANWLKVNNTYTAKDTWVPPSCFASAICVRCDLSYNEWDAPAYLERGTLEGILDISLYPGKTEESFLYPKSINYIKYNVSDGFVVWGQKTTQKKTGSFDRINVRRSVLRDERYLYQLGRTFIGKGNSLYNRRLFIDTATPFFSAKKSAGGMYDYKIVCDETNNTNTVIANNEFRFALLEYPISVADYVVGTVIVSKNQDVTFEEMLSQEA